MLHMKSLRMCMDGWIVDVQSNPVQLSSSRVQAILTMAMGSMGSINQLDTLNILHFEEEK